MCQYDDKCQSYLNVFIACARYCKTEKFQIFGVIVTVHWELIMLKALEFKL
jgi:hypothetical protein